MNVEGYSAADMLELVLPGSRRSALTTAQVAALIYGVPVDAGEDRAVNRKRRSAIRNVQKATMALRLRGIPVCGGDDGLWRAQDAAEALEAYRSLRSRALGQLRTAAAVKRAAFAMQRAEQKVEQTRLPWSEAA